MQSAVLIGYCEVCGNKKAVFEYGDTLPHNYQEDGKCSYCGFTRRDLGDYQKVYTHDCEWVHNSNGTWSYYKMDALCTGKQYIDGYMYYFDDNYIMQTNKWIYKDEGILYADNGWYYAYSSGKLATGWAKINSAWYYFDPETIIGVMQTGWLSLDGATYYLGTSGAMITGWNKIDGTWYYFNGSGIMQTGWQKISGKWYYMDST